MTEIFEYNYQTFDVGINKIYQQLSGSTAITPPIGYVNTFFDVDGELYKKDSNGLITLIGSGTSGSTGINTFTTSAVLSGTTLTMHRNDGVDYSADLSPIAGGCGGITSLFKSVILTSTGGTQYAFSVDDYGNIGSELIVGCTGTTTYCVIITSNNGVKFNLTVDDSGNISTELI